MCSGFLGGGGGGGGMIVVVVVVLLFTSLCISLCFQCLCMCHLCAMSIRKKTIPLPGGAELVKLAMSTNTGSVQPTGSATVSRLQ